MSSRQLGNTGISISPLIMGTWQAGRQMWVDIDDADSVRAIRAALDAGVTAIDTASVYGDGHAERIVARALGADRNRVVIATKVFANALKHDQVLAACERSLTHLETDYIDLYQIHWPSGAFGSDPVPIEETLQAMAKLKAQGKIRAIGVSNFSRAQLAEAQEYGEIVSLQPPYSLFWRQVEQDARPLCLKRNLAILAYSPMAQGLLTGKFGADHRFKPGDHRAQNRLFQPDNLKRAHTALAQLRVIAGRYNATLGQLALAWVMAQPNTFAIAGARNAEQAAQNAASVQIEIASEDLAAMDRIGRQVTDHLDDDPVMWKW